MRHVDVCADECSVDGLGRWQGSAVGHFVRKGLVVTRRADFEIAAGEDLVQGRGYVVVGDGVGCVDVRAEE